MRTNRLRPWLVLGLALALGLPWPGVSLGAGDGKEVSGNLVLDGKTVALEHAYVDESDADEPIVVLSDKPLPADAVPFLPEKLVKEKGIHAVGFSVSRKDKRLTNTFGKVYGPGHELGVGLGRMEDERVRLVIQRLDASAIEGTIKTVKPVVLSSASYSFELTFRAPAGKKKG
jgi:hypothetical protein